MFRVLSRHYQKEILWCHSWIYSQIRQAGSHTIQNINSCYFLPFNYRLTPPYAIMMLFMATIFTKMGNGPMWYINEPAAEDCRQNWWSGLLYVQNFVSPSSAVRKIILSMKKVNINLEFAVFGTILVFIHGYATLLDISFYFASYVLLADICTSNFGVLDYRSNVHYICSWLHQ